MAVLKLSGVDKVYPSGSVALYGINLQTADKEFFVVLGGEGSGKQDSCHCPYQLPGTGAEGQRADLPSDQGQGCLYR